MLSEQDRQRSCEGGDTINQLIWRDPLLSLEDWSLFLHNLPLTVCNRTGCI